MRKNVIRIVAGLAVAGGLAVGGAAIASAQDENIPPYPSVAEEQAIWNEGGAEFGSGAAKLVSAAWVGIPAQAMDYFEEGATFFGGMSGGSLPVK